ncbi:MAG: hypothetical protein Q4E88_06400 [Coriobacteriia bacterium]|nr:hypothetical protein [Coriobacteriia bacterium]
MAKHAKDNSELDDEVIELEFDEDSVAYYIVDENDKEIGVCVIENGEEVEYMYDEESELADVQEKLNSVKEDLQAFSGDALVSVKELKQTTDELQKAYDEIMNSFKIFGKKK